MKSSAVLIVGVILVGFLAFFGGARYLDAQAQKRASEERHSKRMADIRHFVDDFTPAYQLCEDLNTRKGWRNLTGAQSDQLKPVGPKISLLGKAYRGTEIDKEAEELCTKAAAYYEAAWLYAVSDWRFRNGVREISADSLKNMDEALPGMFEDTQAMFEKLKSEK